MLLLPAPAKHQPESSFALLTASPLPRCITTLITHTVPALLMLPMLPPPSLSQSLPPTAEQEKQQVPHHVSVVAAAAQHQQS
jgi:hypothetical protein